MKRKIGTIVDDDLYEEVKHVATHERRHISDVVQLALKKFVDEKKHRTPLKSGLQRFLEREPFHLTPEQFRESMEADFYDQ